MKYFHDLYVPEALILLAVVVLIVLAGVMLSWFAN
jgi:hypothetical protein